MHTRLMLEEELTKAGIHPDDTVIVHSSMKKIGLVDGGGDTVIDALMDYFRNGLLVFPTLTYTLFHDYDLHAPVCRQCLETHPAGHCLAREWVNGHPEFHVNTTPSCVGLLPNLFRVRPQVVRSLNPSHSVAAAGKEAEAFIAGHEQGTTPCGKKSPWWKLYLRRAKILHLGSPLSSSTFMHGVDEWMHPEVITPLIPNPVAVFDRHEQRVPMAPQHLTSGSANLLDKFEKTFEEMGALTRFPFGDTTALTLDCRMVADFFLL